MQVGDVVLRKTDGDSDLRWVGVVSFVDGDFIEANSMCTTLRNGKRILYNVDTTTCGGQEDFVILGHVDQSVYSGEGKSVSA